MKSLQECGQPEVDIQNQFNTLWCHYPQYRKCWSGGRKKKIKKKKKRKPSLFLVGLNLVKEWICLSLAQCYYLCQVRYLHSNPRKYQSGRRNSGSHRPCWNPKSPPHLPLCPNLPLLQQGPLRDEPPGPEPAPNSEASDAGLHCWSLGSE